MSNASSGARDHRPSMSKLFTDGRFALRSLVRARSVTVFAVLAFALGIGITTAVFSLFYGVLLRPLPFPDPDRIVVVYDTQPACATCPASFEKYTDWKTRNQVFSVIGGSTAQQAVVTEPGEPQRIAIVRTTASLGDVFGLPAARGRWYTESEDQPGGPKVAVLADTYWRQRFGADPNVIGRRLTIDGEPYQVIGVMPPEFTHRRGDVYVPLQRKLDEGNRGNHFLAAYARLKPGITPALAQREMVALGKTLALEFHHNHGIDVEPYYQAVVGGVIQPLRVMMGAVGLLLLVSCANVANLLLASGLARRRELALRTALGANQWDLARQLTVEGIVLALTGGILGLAFAAWAVRTFVRLADTSLPRATSISLDGTVLLFALAVSLVTGIVCGLWPVLRLKTKTLSSEVRAGDLRAGSSAGTRRFGDGLVVAEIAMAFSLLVGAGLLVKNLLHLEAKDTGFTADRVVAFDVAPTGVRYQDVEKQKQFYRDLLPALGRVPGVTSVGLTSHLPMYAYGWNGEVTLEGGNPWAANQAPLIEDRWIGGDYFKTMGIAIVKGRPFDDHDRAGAGHATILSVRSADKFWPGQNPIGRHLWRGSASPGNTQYEVVGVSHDVLSYGLGARTPYEMYMPIEQEPFGAMTVVLRTENADPTLVMPTARRAVAQADKLLPVSRVQSLESVVSESVTQPRLLSSLAGLFGALAGVLAAVGVYGVMAYNVRRTRREFGIRLALGADPKRVRRLVVARGLQLGGLGVVLGAGGAMLLTRTMQAMLSDVKPTDPAVFALTAALLLVVAMLACYLPALQASRTDPMVVLRTE
jgi:putative ABC transport system permease protein